jgi:membrane protein implicated in regulation of membrane protease activity
MQKVLGMMLLVVGASTFAMGRIAVVPEIGVSSAGSALALLSGTLLVIRGRRKQ